MGHPRLVYPHPAARQEHALTQLYPLQINDLDIECWGDKAGSSSGLWGRLPTRSEFTKSEIAARTEAVSQKPSEPISPRDSWAKAADYFLGGTLPGSPENPIPLAEAPLACAAAALGLTGISCGPDIFSWVRESARSTMPSNIGIKESAGRG